MTLTIEDIKESAKIVNENGLTENTLTVGEQFIDLMPMTVVLSKATLVATVNVVKPAIDGEEALQHKGRAITSPMVGTFYTSPSVWADSFITVGKRVAVGDVVCIIETMRMMNEIELDYSGTITEICVENGEHVEYGQVLMYIE